MEEVSERRLVVKLKESAGLRGAVALRGFLKESGHAQIYRDDIESIEIVTEKLHFIGPDDCKEYESGHNLRDRTLNYIWRDLYADLQKRRGESPVANLRWRISGDEDPTILFAAEDLNQLASQIMERKAIVRGIGPDKASHLLGVSAVAMTEIED